MPDYQSRLLEMPSIAIEPEPRHGARQPPFTPSHGISLDMSRLSFNNITLSPFSHYARIFQRHYRLRRLRYLPFYC